MGPAILGGVVLLFILLAYLGAKAWHVWQVVLVVFLFLTAWFAFILTASTMKTQQRWRADYNNQVASLEREQQAQQRLIEGVLEPEPEPSMAGLRAEVSRVVLDRGRVWRNLRLANIGQGTLTFDASNWGDRGFDRIGLDTTDEESIAPPPDEPDEPDEPAEPVAEPPAEPADEADAAADEADAAADEPAADAAAPAPAAAAAPAAGTAPPLGMTTGAIVYAFKEQPASALAVPLQRLLYEASPLPDQDTKGLCQVPGFYMGEYRVTSDPAADPKSLTLVPTLDLSPVQIEQLQQQDNATWVLYEVMPTDSHEALEGLNAEQLRLLIEAPADLPPEKYELLIDEYVRDQTRASEMDPPERKWMRVKFLKPHSVDVDVQTPTRLPGAAYDPSGRSVTGTLQQNAATEFQEGDEAALDFETAQELIGQGIAEQVEPVYQRRLRDYAEHFRGLARNFELIDRQVATAQEDLKKLTDSVTGLREQIAFQTEQQKLLTEDRDGFNRERTVITEYRGALEEQWNALRRDLSRIYRANKQVVQQRELPDRGARRTLPPATRPTSLIR